MKKLFAFLGLAIFAFLTMAPSYNATAPACPTAACLYPGQSGLLFNAEQPAASTRSQQFLIPWSNSQPTTNLSVECIWTSNPGTFNYQIQVADTDATGNYVTIASAGTITSAPQVVGSGNYVARVDLNPFRGTYVSLWVASATANAVNTTCRLSR